MLRFIRNQLANIFDRESFQLPKDWADPKTLREVWAFRSHMMPTGDKDYPYEMMLCALGRMEGKMPVYWMQTLSVRANGSFEIEPGGSMNLCVGTITDAAGDLKKWEASHPGLSQYQAAPMLYDALLYKLIKETRTKNAIWPHISKIEQLMKAVPPETDTHSKAPVLSLKLQS